MSEQTIKSKEEMQILAAEFASTLKGGEILLLVGELGAGKTTFTQGIAKALGIKAEVTSPTFTLVGEYEVTTHPTIKRLVHVDLYRLSDEQAQRDPAIAEVLAQASDPTHLTIIEWADKLGGQVPAYAKKILFQHGVSSELRIISQL